MHSWNQPCNNAVAHSSLGSGKKIKWRIMDPFFWWSCEIVRSQTEIQSEIMFFALLKSNHGPCATWWTTPPGSLYMLVFLIYFLAIGSSLHWTRKDPDARNPEKIPPLRRSYGCQTITSTIGLLKLDNPVCVDIYVYGHHHPQIYLSHFLMVFTV